MLSKIAIYAIVGLAGVCVTLFFVAKHFYKKQKTVSKEYYYLRSTYNALEGNYNALKSSVQAKKEVQDEKDRQLTEIASGSADDAIVRLQNRNNKRSNENSSS